MIEYFLFRCYLLIRAVFSFIIFLQKNFIKSRNSVKCPFRLVVRTSPFHGENMGSIPVRDTMLCNIENGSVKKI